MPENWTRLPEGFELTWITNTATGEHPRPMCGYAVNIRGIGWCSDCMAPATHGYRGPVRRSMTTYDDYACDKHLDKMADQLSELED